MSFIIMFNEESSKEVVGTMCNLSLGIKENAILTSIRNLMDSMKCSFEKACELLKVPAEELEILRSKINQSD